MQAIAKGRVEVTGSWETFDNPVGWFIYLQL